MRRVVGSADYFALDPATAPIPVFLFGFGEIHHFTDLSIGVTILIIEW